MVGIESEVSKVPLLEETAGALRGTGDSKDEARAEVIEGMLSARGGTDLVLVINGAPIQRGIISTSPEKTLVLATANLRNNPNSPEAVWEYFNAHYTRYSPDMGLSPSDVVVSGIPYTEQDLMDLSQFKDTLGHPVPRFPFNLPRILSTTPDGLVLLGKAFPYMYLPSTGSRNTAEIYDWISVEPQKNAPYRTNQKGEVRGFNEDEIRGIFKKLGVVGQTLNVYAGSGPVIRNLSISVLEKGYFPDQIKTAVRLLESVNEDRVLGASFGKGGDCDVDWSLGRESRGPDWGARSAGVKKA